MGAWAGDENVENVMFPAPPPDDAWGWYAAGLLLLDICVFVCLSFSVFLLFFIHVFFCLFVLRVCVFAIALLLFFFAHEGMLARHTTTTRFTCYEGTCHFRFPRWACWCPRRRWECPWCSLRRRRTLSQSSSRRQHHKEARHSCATAFAAARHPN